MSLDPLLHRVSYWRTAASPQTYPPLQGELECDVVVVGAGISGLTASRILAEAGYRVVVLEKTEIGGGESGNTTAHLTQAIDTRYHALTSRFGREGARKVAASSRAAISHIARTCEALEIDCRFERLDGYLYTEGNDQEDLKRESEAAKAVGVDAVWVDQVPLPFSNNGGIRFEAQGAFHPLHYLRGLAHAISVHGGRIYEGTAALEFEDGEPLVIRTDGGRVKARDAIVTTHIPASNRFVLITKVAAYRTYVVGLDLPAAQAIHGLYWDTADPYHYLRWYPHTPEHGLLIVGGSDHKTGAEVDTAQCFDRLKDYASSRFPSARVAYEWSGQILEPVDGLPYIGRNPQSNHEWVATGFSGNGMTFGCVAGMILADGILGRANRWADVYSASRFKPIASAKEYVTENKDYAICMLKDRVRGSNGKSIADIPLGEGRLLSLDGAKVAVYKDEGGEITALSPVCPHLGCYVHFNRAERSWDCPCHGSRFSGEGKVLNGPAVSDLAPWRFEEKKRGEETKKPAAA